MKARENAEKSEGGKGQAKNLGGAGAEGEGGAWDVLVVDGDPAAAELVRKGAGGMAQRVRIATTIDAAQAEMKKSPADLLLVNLQINDNAGTEFIRTLKRKYPGAETIAVSRVKRMEVCMDAWRAGAADLILSPLHVQEVKRSLSDLSGRRGRVLRLADRNERLRSVCKQLNKARHDISRQVDLLCNDLVKAYQDLAQQLNQAQLSADYGELVNHEVDMETLLRRTMEWILRKLGPINAAIYLPDAEQHFALGAYLNLDTAADAELIQTMGQTIVKQAQAASTVTIEDDRAIDDLFGAEGDALKGRVWLATGCYAKRECMAVLIAFRNAPRSAQESVSATASAVDAMTRGVAEAVAPILGERIQQALSFYHRLHPRPEDADDEYGEAQAG